MNTDLIKHVIDECGTVKGLSDTEIDQVCTFHKNILNIFNSFIHYKTLLFDNSDPPWMKEINCC